MTESAAKELLNRILNRKPNHELADAIESVYKKRKNFRLRSISSKKL